MDLERREEREKGRDKRGEKKKKDKKEKGKKRKKETKAGGGKMHELIKYRLNQLHVGIKKREEKRKGRKRGGSRKKEILEIWGKAQRESARRPKSDWGKLERGG